MICVINEYMTKRISIAQNQQKYDPGAELHSYWYEKPAFSCISRMIEKDGLLPVHLAILRV